MFALQAGGVGPQRSELPGRKAQWRGGDPVGGPLERHESVPVTTGSRGGGVVERSSPEVARPARPAALIPPRWRKTLLVLLLLFPPPGRAAVTADLTLSLR